MDGNEEFEDTSPYSEEEKAKADKESLDKIKKRIDQDKYDQVTGNIQDRHERGFLATGIPGNEHNPTSIAREENLAADIEKINLPGRMRAVAPEALYNKNSEKLTINGIEHKRLTIDNISINAIDLKEIPHDQRSSLAELRITADFPDEKVTLMLYSAGDQTEDMMKLLIEFKDPEMKEVGPYNSGKREIQNLTQEEAEIAKYTIENAFLNISESKQSE